MARYQQIRIGDIVEYDEVECVVESMVFDPNQPATVRLKAVTGTRYHVLGSAISDALLAEPGPDAVDVSAVPLQLDGIAENAQAEALEMLEHMREIETGFRSGNPQDALPHEPRPEYDPNRFSISERLAAKAAELKKTERQMWNLWRRYSENGVYGLVDRRKIRKTNPLASADPRLIEAIRTVGAGETFDSTGTLNRLRRRVKRHLDTVHGVDVVATPSAPTFNRYLKAVLAGRHTFGDSTTRRTTAAQPDHSPSLFTASRPGELVMFDSTRLDVMAFDPDSGESFAVELTFALDLCTRSLLAWRITPVGTKAVDAALMLADMLTPEPMRPGWPDAVRYRVLQIPFERMVSVDERIEEAAARPIILPETIIIDHGKIYVSQAFNDACLRLGISLQLARKGQGTDKANIERLFGTIRTQFSEHVAGYKGRSVAQRGADPESRARWTVGELEEFLAEYVICVYQRRRHAGLTLPGWPEVSLSPNDAYNEAVQRTGVIMVPPNPTLYFELMPTVWCTIRHDGVRVKGLQYRSEVLHRYRNVRSGHSAEGGKWPIKYDPRDRNQVFFQDPDDGSWSAVPWIHRFDETRPFTDKTLDFVKRLIVERGGSTRDDEEVAAALLALQNRMDTPSELIGRERRRAIRDAERARTSARDRASGGLADSPLRAVLGDGSTVVDEPFEITEADIDAVTTVTVFNPQRTRPS